jgi:hypothetical protein
MVPQERVVVVVFPDSTVKKKKSLAKRSTHLVTYTSKSDIIDVDLMLSFYTS